MPAVAGIVAGENSISQWQWQQKQWWQWWQWQRQQQQLEQWQWQAAASLYQRLLHGNRYTIARCYHLYILSQPVPKPTQASLPSGRPFAAGPTEPHLLNACPQAQPVALSVPQRQHPLLLATRLSPPHTSLSCTPVGLSHISPLRSSLRNPRPKVCLTIRDGVVTKS